MIDHLPDRTIPRGAIVAITSKIFSISEQNLHPRDGTDKHDIARADADFVVGDVGYGSMLTVTRGVMILSAGIDESNSPDGSFILYPRDPAASLFALYQDLVCAIGHQEFGLIMTDSRSAPLRNGVTGVALACCGFHGVQDRVGDTDLFGRPLKSTKVNIADALATACVLVMGEADEAQPLAIATGADVMFTPNDTTPEISMPYDKDMYEPLLAALRNGQNI